MIINKIEYENFRNFKEHGEIKCSTDGKVTIIYGKNGDGKTTLHQLFQWIFYGQVKFNRTTTNKLYNLQYESNCSFGENFQVMGCIDFEHEGIKYSLKRVCTYKKGLNDSEKKSEDLTLQYRDNEFNWRRIANPKEVIEKLLPSGLADYFFFDGESMIADLRVKGKDSAMKLKKALYSMFDLDILESSIAHIGRTDLKTTVLGKLYLTKGNILSGGEITTVKANIENAQMHLEELNIKLNEIEKKKKECQNLIVEVSEKIGGHKSKNDYERQRKKLKEQRDAFLKSAIDAQANFGEAFLEMFPRLLISKAVIDAQKKIHLKIEENKLPEGITKKLISYLLNDSADKCICGHSLGLNEKKYIKNYLELLPPNSYTNLYNEFTKTAKFWGCGYDKEKIQNYIITVLENNDLASKSDNEIRELDEIEKKSPDIEDLIVARQQAEEKVQELEEDKNDISVNIKKFEIYINKQMKNFDSLTKGKVESEKANIKIEIMEAVRSYFEKQLAQQSEKYSKILQENIQNLINNMLTSKRYVVVSPEFSVCIKDSYQDESKSEGQFAVVSFAYIGGILKMLSSEQNLSNKEYPLVLDGPFSKLDEDQRKNVVNMLPKFAPQVIIFSKDDLHQVFSSKNIGYVWTIASNDEKNLAHVEEGYLWK